MRGAPGIFVTQSVNPLLGHAFESTSQVSVASGCDAEQFADALVRTTVL